MPDPVERRLAAIMFTDIVGYTALMGGDEEAGRRTRHEALVREQIDRYQGQWISAYHAERQTAAPYLPASACRC